MAKEKDIQLEEVQQLLLQYYDLSGDIKQLPGEVDLNYRVQKDRAQYLLKITRSEESIDLLQMQAELMLHLNTCSPDFEIAKPIRSNDEALVVKYQFWDGSMGFLRLQTWVHGQVFSSIAPKTKELLATIGASLGWMTQSLQHFNHPSTKRYYKWDLAHALDTKAIAEYIVDEEDHTLVNQVFDRFEAQMSTYKQLPKSTIYNDANDYNLLIERTDYQFRLAGVIDFGDVIYSHTINDLAIAIAYLTMDFEDPLDAATALVAGYHDSYSLSEQEIACLHILIHARLAVSVTIAAKNKHDHPDNEYLTVSEKPAWRQLRKWNQIHPRLAEYHFRAACGYEPCPHQPEFLEWVIRNPQKIQYPIDLKQGRVCPIDLSIDSKILGNYSNYQSLERFTLLIARAIEDQQVDFIEGGYLETRPFYSSDEFTSLGNSGSQWRSVHLGHDIWGPAGTPVQAVADGVIHSIANNEGDRNYGSTIIIEHRVSQSITFHTLYGHLSYQSLDRMAVGSAVTKGQCIGYLGIPSENGGWPPHLHCQVILDIFDYRGDFPGVSFPDTASVWKSISPPLPFFKQEKTLHEAQSILQERRQYLGLNLSVSYERPLQMLRGMGSFLMDHQGRKYLDLVNNVAHVGHEHPRVVKAAQDQISILNTNTRYLHPTIVSYARKLIATFPESLQVCYLVNSGSEANELAVRMAKTFSGNQDMIAIEVGYHGNTQNTIEVSSYKFDGEGGQGAPSETHLLPIPDTFRYPDRQGAQFLKATSKNLQTMIDRLANEDKKIAGFIAESILSCGGQIVLPENYLQTVYAIVRNAGGICIADEVQVGFGRTGTAMWAFETQQVVPDIVTLGKPIGNGHPLAAVVCTREVAAAFDNGMEYFNTFGGNPVSAAIGEEVLGIIEDEELMLHADKIGRYLKNRLKGLQAKHPIIGDVRGMGLFLGFELIEDKETIHPAAKQADYLINRLRQFGILLSSDGPFHNVLKIKPPLSISRAEVDFFIHYLDIVLREDFMQLS